MSQTLARPAKGKRARSQPANRSAKRTAAADAALKKRTHCLLDLPALHRAIPRTITLSLAQSPHAGMDDAQLQLAICGAERDSVVLKHANTFAQNVRAAACQALQDAIQRGGLSLNCRWWSNAEAAEHGRAPREGADNSHRQYVGERIVIEFLGSLAHDKLRQAYNVDSSEVLNAFEGVCPGFQHLVYTVLQLVDSSIWPITTPRTLWNDYIYGGDSEASRLCDADIAAAQMDNYLDPEEISKKYGLDLEKELPPSQLVHIFQEEIGAILPSYFLRHFGRAAIGAWPLYAEKPAHESIGSPEKLVHELISIALANMDARPWCPLAPRVTQALIRMDRIVRDIAAGAELASGTYISSNPSTSAIQLWRFGAKTPRKPDQPLNEKEAFTRLLDDHTRGAWESGEAVECAGWFVADASTPEEAREVLSTLERGAATLNVALDLILQLFSPLNNNASKI